MLQARTEQGIVGASSSFRRLSTPRVAENGKCRAVAVAVATQVDDGSEQAGGVHADTKGLRSVPSLPCATPFVGVPDTSTYALNSCALLRWLVAVQVHKADRHENGAISAAVPWFLGLQASIDAAYHRKCMEPAARRGRRDVVQLVGLQEGESASIDCACPPLFVPSLRTL